MTYAYIGPFQYITDLHKPANNATMLIAEFDLGSMVHVTNSPDPENIGYEDVYQYPGNVYVWRVPKYSDMTPTQKLALINNLVFTSGSGWRYKDTGPYYATRELAIAGATGRPATDFVRGAFVSTCLFVHHDVTRVILSPFSQTLDRAYDEVTNIPFHVISRGNGSNVSFNTMTLAALPSNTPEVITPAALAAEVPISEYTLNNSNTILLTDGSTKIRDGGGTFTPPALEVDLTTHVPGTISGETAFNTNRTGALLLEGTLKYPAFVHILVADFGPSAVTVTHWPTLGIDSYRYDGTLYTYKVPITAFSDDYYKYWISNIGIYDTTGGGYRGWRGTTGNVYFSTIAEALAYTLDVPNSHIQQVNNLGACYFYNTFTLRSGGASVEREHIYWSNLPVFQWKYGDFFFTIDWHDDSSPASWTTGVRATSSNSTLDALIVSSLATDSNTPYPFGSLPDMSGCTIDTMLLKQSGDADFYGFYNPPGNSPAPSMNYSVTVSVPGTISGNPDFNTQRTGALPYAGTIVYP